MMLSDQGDETLGESDEADTEGSVVDHRFDCIIVRELFAVEPESSHKERELLLESGLLEVESFVELLCRDLEHVVKLLEECVDPVFLILYLHTFDRELHYVHCGERKVSAADRCLRSEAVLEHTCAASHCSNLVLVSLRIVRSPELVVVVWSVKVHEVREETACRYLACKLVKVIVAVFRKVAYASFLLPDLDREDRCGTVSYALVCCVEDLADHAAALSRSVCTIVD